MDLREQVERQREFVRMKQEEQRQMEWARAQREKVMARLKKTPWGLVERPADVTANEAELDRWHDDIAAALDAAEAAEKRERALSGSSVDPERFPAASGGAR